MPTKSSPQPTRSSPISFVVDTSSAVLSRKEIKAVRTAKAAIVRGLELRKQYGLEPTASKNDLRIAALAVGVKEYTLGQKEGATFVTLAEVVGRHKEAGVTYEPLRKRIKGEVEPGSTGVLTVIKIILFVLVC